MSQLPSFLARLCAEMDSAAKSPNRKWHSYHDDKVASLLFAYRHEIVALIGHCAASPMVMADIRRAVAPLTEAT